MKNIIKAKLLLLLVPALAIFTVIFVVVVAVCGYETGNSIANEKVASMRANSSVINSQLYAERYRSLLNKYLTTKGYVSLERMVFYLQRIHNVLDTSTLTLEDWEKAYLENINEEEKQMIPIKTVCKNLNSDTSLSTFSVESGMNDDGVSIDVIDLCHVNGVDVATSDDYSEYYFPLIYSFPLKSKFTVTSIVFEHRNVDLGLSEKEQENVNFHSGWDLAVPIGTSFYSICDGTVSSIVNTQNNDLPFNQSGNKTGNHMSVTCSNGYTAIYYHLQYNSQPYMLKVNSKVKKGDLLGRTSTTGQSTGGHLHLGLKDTEGNLLDAMAYIDFVNYEGAN